MARRLTDQQAAQWNEDSNCLRTMTAHSTDPTILNLVRIAEERTARYHDEWKRCNAIIEHVKRQAKANRRLALLDQIRAKHDERARAANFKRCGCGYCRVVRADI